MHMHTYILNPRSAAPVSGRQYRPQIQSNKQGANAQALEAAGETQDGKTICKGLIDLKVATFINVLLLICETVKVLLVLLEVYFILGFNITLKL